jgi:aromatic amino acid aminotransferase I
MRRAAGSQTSLRRLSRSLHSSQSEVGCVTANSRRFHNKSKDSSEAIGTAAKLPNAEPIPPIHAKHSTSLSDILERRAKAGKLVAGTAAYSDSDMFKAPVCQLSLKLPAIT